MPLSDVTVRIDLNQPSGLIGFGKPLILATTETGEPYREYADLEPIATDYGADSQAYYAAEALFSQGDYRPERVAIAAAPFSATGFTDVLRDNYNRDWYFVILTSDAQADQITVADYIEANGRKMFAARVPTIAQLQALEANEYDRTFAFYHTSPDSFPEAALVGAAGSRDVGSVTWKNMQLNNIVSLDLSQTDLNLVDDANGITYVKKAGESGTSEGTVLSGEYIDVIMSKDWIQVNIENAVQKVLARSPKVPYTNAGIGQLEAATLGVLQAGYRQDMIADNADGLPAFSTDFPTREETTPGDRAARHLDGAKFSFELAGAIHTATITGTISY